MARCTKTTNLEVYHRRRDGGNGIDNAEVLCKDCYASTTSDGTPGINPPDFSEETKNLVFYLAGNQCQCIKTSGCHKQY
jgi:hypothetical protein